MYIGKFLDGFDYAVRLLFGSAGFTIIPPPDCLSHRILGFKDSSDFTECFRPKLCWQRYLPALSRNLGCPQDIKFCPAKNFDLKELAQDLVLFGEVTLPKCEWSVKDRFYQNYPTFLLCRRDEAGTPFLCNPLGCHWIESNNSEIALMLRESDGFILMFCPHSELRPTEVTELRCEALSMRDECCLALNIDAKQVLTGRKKLALHYGLVNYLSLRIKVGKFYGLSERFFTAIAEATHSLIELNFECFKRVEYIEQLFWTEMAEGE